MRGGVGHVDFVPLALGNLDAVDGEGVEEFVGEDDADDGVWEGVGHF